jgi:hypothetical protein
MSVEEQLQMGVLLSQEAYRDGVVTEDNYLETRGAVLGHTEMAARMRDAGYNIADNPFIALDLAAYDYAQSVGDMSLMDLYADMLYRSDGDYMDFNWGAAWGSFGWGGIGTLLFGSPENKATVFQDAVVAGMEKEDEFDYMEKNYEKIKSEYDYKKLSFGSFNLSDYQMQIASVYGLIKKNAAAIDNGIDKLGVFQELARGAKNFIYDMANWIETRGNFTFLEGLYYTHQGGASFKIATGNMLTSPLMVGLYEQNLFKRGDRAALTIGMDIGVSAWTNGLLFKDITLGFKYAFPAFNLEVQHPRLL